MDLREELLKKIMLHLCDQEIGDLDKIKDVLVRCLGDYEIKERCTDLTVPDDSNMKLIKIFLGSKRTEGGSKTTMKNRAYTLKRFSEEIGKPFTEVTTFDVRIWLAEKQKTAKLSTCESYRTTIASFFRWLLDEGMIDKDPMAKIKSIKHPEAAKKSFSTVEVDAMRCVCKDVTERAIIELLLSSGLRVAELCELKWDDINFLTKEVYVREGKGGKNRTTMMDDVAKKYIQEHQKTAKESEYIFPVLYRKQIQKRSEKSVQSLISEIGTRANLPECHPHRFRHTFATTMYKRGMDLHMIQRFLGHRNINTTLIYIDSDTNAMQDAYKRCI